MSGVVILTDEPMITGNPVFTNTRSVETARSQKFTYLSASTSEIPPFWYFVHRVGYGLLEKEVSSLGEVAGIYILKGKVVTYDSLIVNDDRILSAMVEEEVFTRLQPKATYTISANLEFLGKSEAPVVDPEEF